MTTFGKHTPRKTRPIGLDGTQWLFSFPNGYGASVINDGHRHRRRGGQDRRRNPQHTAKHAA